MSKNQKRQWHRVCRLLSTNPDAIGETVKILLDWRDAERADLLKACNLLYASVSRLTSATESSDIDPRDEAALTAARKAIAATKGDREAGAQ